MTTLKCAYATASVDAISGFAARHFDLDPITSCRLLWRGFNDGYVIDAGARRLVLRLSRAGRRRAPDLEYEAILLTHLRTHGIPVPEAISGGDGCYAKAAQSPEGERNALLFDFISGRDPEETPADMYAQGKTLASMHAASMEFAPAIDRFKLDLNHLLDQPLAALNPLLRDRPEIRRYLVELAGRLRRSVSDCAVSLTYGVCHGDSHGFNARIAEDGTATLLDFDDGGPGWLAYDLAV